MPDATTHLYKYRVPYVVVVVVVKVSGNTRALAQPKTVTTAALPSLHASSRAVVANASAAVDLNINHMQAMTISPCLR